MTNKSPHSLLPAGMVDLLPPDAELESSAIESLMTSFKRNGYDQVNPPLAEFEENLMHGSGAATATQSFRLMDPISQEMMALRADMTIQIERIASSRLLDLPRPLRLSYTGQVLRVTGSDLRPQRQFSQVGAELIGSEAPSADVEIILMAAKGLLDLGIVDLSVDLGMPTLVEEICDDIGIVDEDERRFLRTALNQKDAAAISEIGGKSSKVFNALLSAVGPVATSLDVIKKIQLSAQAELELNHLESVVVSLKDRAPWLTITMDPVEIRGYEYHKWLTFTIFARGIRGELGRGGRYVIVGNSGSSEREFGTGVTLFIDTVVDSLPKPDPPKRVFIPLDSNEELANNCSREGWITIAELIPSTNQSVEAIRLGCTHILHNDKIEKL